jgi:pyrroline-5-carboxylate reductase
MSAATAERSADPALGAGVGILGAGRLGSALALALLARGLPRDRLLLATRGSEESRARLEAAGLSELLVPGAELARAEVLIVALRPQSVAALGPLGLGEGATAAFCVAGLSTARLDEESMIDAFTAAVCMPAAIVLAEESAQEGLEALAAEMPELARVFRWAPTVLPAFASEEARAAYVDRMVTPGGVTERVVAAIRAGRGLRDAFYAGLRRAEELGVSAG